jgi:hypothetical protein
MNADASPETADARATGPDAEGSDALRTTEDQSTGEDARNGEAEESGEAPATDDE